MSVILILGPGRFGNQIFKYITARIYAFNNKLDFSCREKFDNKLIEFFEPKKYNNKAKGIYKLTFKDFDKNDNLLFFGNKRYIINDYFQNANYINMHINIIYSFIKHFNYPIDYYFPYNINNDDVLLLIRIGDFVHQGENSEVLDPGYYIQILEKYAFSKVYINIYPNNDVYSSYYLSYFSLI